MTRTVKQEQADDFDCKLYALIEEAHRNKWDKVVVALEEARPFVRSMMHKLDRENTR